MHVVETRVAHLAMGLLIVEGPGLSAVSTTQFAVEFTSKGFETMKTRNSVARPSYLSAMAGSVIQHHLHLGTSLLCLYFYLLCYAAVLTNFTYYAQYSAHVKDLCLGIQYFAVN